MDRVMTTLTGLKSIARWLAAQCTPSWTPHRQAVPEHGNEGLRRLRIFALWATTLVVATGRAGAQEARLTLALKQPFEATALRIAVADTMGDGKQRVIWLSPMPKGAKLSVAKWDGKGLATEWTTEVPGAQPTLAVGRFCADTTASQIITSKGCWWWNGTAYALLPTDRTLIPLGTVRTPAGAESVLIREGSEFSAFRINLKAEGDKWLEKQASPGAGAATGEFVFGMMHAPPSELGAGSPPEFATTGLLGFWTLPKAAKPLRILGRTDAKANVTHVVLARSIGPKAVDEAWRGGPLDGPIADITIGDPRGDGRVGLVVLTAADPKGKGRTLYLWLPE